MLTPTAQTTLPPSYSAAPLMGRASVPQVATQLASAMPTAAGGTTEIALNPEELGRVRMTLTTGEQGLTMTIVTERPETADLMRRNLDQLIQEFRDMGHASLTFSFGDTSAGGGTSDSENHSSHRPHIAAADDTPAHIPSRTAPTGGLDLKL
ncbi:flagellar hook-length control protein FliK [Thalassorhabdomicrobium marinisediminis]|uniref:flagellar hook-length control protein FliK n=1 Tax=Thalassorhabdomicrobium marinisediminis TaxID=2170577 RepID=UPI00249189AA|nr:flagellar hook-length control protein FliK [Thalassorhabdomicrobium marinisediminis]